MLWFKKNYFKYKIDPYFLLSVILLRERVGDMYKEKDLRGGRGKEAVWKHKMAFPWLLLCPF